MYELSSEVEQLNSTELSWNIFPVFAISFILLQNIVQWAQHSTGEGCWNFFQNKRFHLNRCQELNAELKQTLFSDVLCWGSQKLRVRYKNHPCLHPPLMGQNNCFRGHFNDRLPLNTWVFLSPVIYWVSRTWDSFTSPYKRTKHFLFWHPLVLPVIKHCRPFWKAPMPKSSP